MLSFSYVRLKHPLTFVHTGSSGCLFHDVQNGWPPLVPPFSQQHVMLAQDTRLLAAEVMLCGVKEVDDIEVPLLLPQMRCRLCTAYNRTIWWTNTEN